MPSWIGTTTPGALEDALIGVIASIVPTIESHRDAGWIHKEYNREVGHSSTVPRHFRTEILQGGIVPGGITGSGDSEMFLAFDVIVDYRAFEEQELGRVISSDHLDLYEAFQESINVIPGLTQCAMDGDAELVGEEDEARFLFPFVLQFMWARRF